MSRLSIRAVGTEQISISGMPPLLVLCLRELPDILKQRNEPKARSRLFPPLTSDDAKANHEWEQLISPELELLFASSGETVTRDLHALQFGSTKSQTFRITFAMLHLNAWMSAINEARLILGELFDVTEQDLANDAPDVTNPKQLAVLKISALGWLLGYLIEFASGDSDLCNPV